MSYQDLAKLTWAVITVTAGFLLSKVLTYYFGVGVAMLILFVLIAFTILLSAYIKRVERRIK